MSPRAPHARLPARPLAQGYLPMVLACLAAVAALSPPAFAKSVPALEPISEAKSALRPASPRPRAQVTPRPLNVRRGDTYDGRPPAKDPYLAARVVPTTVLFLPRLALDIVLRTSEALSDWLERSGALYWTRRILWAQGGRFRLLPLGLWQDDMTPRGGLLMATDLLFGTGRRAGLVAEGTYGARGVFGASLRLELLGLALTGRPEPPGRVRLALSGGYDRTADMPFFGLGRERSLAGTLEERAVYGRELANASAALEVALWRSLALRISAGFDWRRLSNGPQSAAERLSEVYGEAFMAYGEAVSTFLGALSIAAGGRQGALLPAPGIRVEATASVFAGATSTGRIVSVEGRLEAFAPLGQGAQRLGLRGQVAGLAVLGGEEALPLPYLPSLGGLTTMRGYATGRFRGESVAWVALEHYAALHPRLWLCVFLEWGGAWREGFTRSAPEPWSHWDGGGWLGLRVAPGYWIQVQVAGSREGPHVFAGVRGTP